MDDCIAVLGCTYIGGGGGTPRGGAQEVPEPPPPYKGRTGPKYKWTCRPNMGPVYKRLNTILTGAADQGWAQPREEGGWRQSCLGFRGERKREKN
jgi:hypothetical protein